MADCEKVDSLLINSFQTSLRVALESAFKGENDLSENELKQFLFDNYEKDFRENGLSEFYNKLYLKGVLESEALNIKAIAAFSKAMCNDSSLFKIEAEDYERKLSYCNSAAGRSKSGDAQVQQQVTYDCVLKSL